MSERFTTGSSLADWRSALVDINLAFAQQLEESTDPYADASELGLQIPTYRVFDNITTFLAQSESEISEVDKEGFSEYYVSLRPTNPKANLLKYRAMLAGDQIGRYVRESIPETHFGNYNVRFAGHLPEICGGSILIGFDGSIDLEMVIGNQAKLSSGKDSPKFTGHTNSYGNMKYEFEDVKFREHAWNAISAIPYAKSIQYPDSFRNNRHPGYYEFAHEMQPNGFTRLMFYDYRYLQPGSPFLLTHH